MCKMSCSVCKIYRGFPSADYSTYASDVTKQTALLYASSCSFMWQKSGVRRCKQGSVYIKNEMLLSLRTYCTACVPTGIQVMVAFL
jgi:hypothetical protein